LIINNKKIEAHFLYKYQKYSIGEPLFRPLCDKDLKTLDIKNIELTLDYKLVDCKLCRRLATRTLGIKIYPRGTSRGYYNRWNKKQARKSRNSKLENIPNWKRFKSHKNLNKEGENLDAIK
jgi:hypothetical protein